MAAIDEASAYALLERGDVAADRRLGRPELGDDPFRIRRRVDGLHCE
jgi:hypothetical protein